jgi:hypothetical protein
MRDLFHRSTMTINRAIAVAMLAMGLLAGCDAAAPRAGEGTPQRAVPQPPPPLPPRPRPAPPPVAIATPTAPVPPAIDWRDAPLPAGDWQWLERKDGDQARFGPPGQPPLLIMTCDRANGSVQLALPSSSGGAQSATIATSTASAGYPAATRTVGTLPALVVNLPASDRMLDAMAFSRGRFRLRFDNGVELIAPSWAEVGRLVEDCRG